jgi:hypothetical protein
MKLIVTLLIGLLFSGICLAQNLLPSPFSYVSCISFASPTGWVNCTASPDCAASRCTVPAGCTGQAVMCFGESFRYVLPAPLVVGQAYTITMNVSTGQLGANSIIAGNHTFRIIGLTTAPTNCGGANYGSVCSTPGATTLLTGTVNTIGWVTFTNTFTAAAPIQHIVIGNCDGTGNGGNLFCNPSLTPSVPFPVTLQAFDATANDCTVDLNWKVDNADGAIDHFELMRSSEGTTNEVVAKVQALHQSSEYAFSDLVMATENDYQLTIHHKDGTISQSEVLRVESNCEGASFAIEGNPVQGPEAILRYEASGNPMMLTISNVEGRVVYQKPLESTDAGWQRLRLDVSGLQPGIYFVSLGDGQVAKLRRI